MLVLGVAITALAQPPAIFDAARKGDVTRLRANQAQLNARGLDNRTPLHEAAAFCQPDAARLLVDLGADRAALDNQKRTPGMLALLCQDQNARAVLYQILQPPPPPGVAEPWALQYAVSRGQGSIVSMLLTLNVDVNAVDPNGDRALDIACLKGDPGIVRLLLSRGANPTLRNKTGATPLHDAALKGSPEIIDLLIQKGADPNAPDTESSATPLHYAASFGHAEAVSALLLHGARGDRKDAKGLTPLETAQKNGHTEAATLLQRH